MAQLTLRKNLHELKEALAERDRAEEERERLLEELRKLSDLLPLSTACQFNLVIPADQKAIPAVVQGVMKIVREKCIDPGHEADVEIALGEALANAVKHGCADDPTKHIQCCVAIESDGELLVVVRDPGDGFDPATVPSPVADARHHEDQRAGRVPHQSVHGRGPLRGRRPHPAHAQACGASRLKIDLFGPLALTPLTASPMKGAASLP